MSRINSPEQIESMRQGGKILAAVLQSVTGAMRPGMTTEDLDDIAAAETKRLGGKAAFLGHEGFPKSICISVNDEVVHGIPGARRIDNGDLIGLDFGIRLNGMITDSAVTVPLGEPTAAAARLLKITEEALYVGIDQARPGSHVGDISAAIERYLRKAGLGIIKELAGHGVGEDLWEEPHIPNVGTAGTGPVLKEGMTIAIEPMATLGGPRIEALEDDWTIVTRDGSLAAQFEHTVLITRGAPEILTQA